MNGQTSPPLKNVVLISTPWPLFDRPSIQLGTLKAYLKLQFADLNVTAHHLYLNVAAAIGYKLYHAVSERTWLAETVYAALLYPERLSLIEKMFNREAASKPLLRNMGFQTLIRRVKAVSDAFIGSTDWETCGVAGFSVCLCQLTSALYFIKRIKASAPHLNIVVGGSMFAGESIRGLLQVFPEVDFVVTGEGERPLSRLIDHLINRKHNQAMPSIPGLITREPAQDSDPVAFSQMGTLDRLPPPDYDEYFNVLKTLGPQKTFFPRLSAEVSRGCWWRRPQQTGRHTGCAFCNLNLQWEGYRSKRPSQVVAEIDHLTARYQVLSVAFMDNALPVKESREIFVHLGNLGKDISLFGEIRATTTRPMLAAMQAAGMREVQIGIEALSTQLLKKLNKGTTAIQNLEIMKHCEELGVVNNSNLILDFPGSGPEDVAETIRTLTFALPFRPLRCVHFWLGLASPVWEDPRAYGIRAVFNHPNYAVLFPPAIVRAMRFMIQAYRGDRGYQKKLWQPVKQKVRSWKEAYDELHNGPSCTPILSFQDGRDFLIIRQRRFKAEPLTHRLTGTSRAIYLFCRRHRALKRVVNQFAGIGEERIVPFLKMMVDKKLMFEEKGRYLSLAVQARPER